MTDHNMDITKIIKYKQRLQTAYIDKGKGSNVHVCQSNVFVAIDGVYGRALVVAARLRRVLHVAVEYRWFAHLKIKYFDIIKYDLLGVVAIT